MSPNKRETIEIYCPECIDRHSFSISDQTEITKLQPSKKTENNKAFKLFSQEPVKLRFRLAVLDLSHILRLNYFLFVLKLVACRPFRND